MQYLNIIYIWFCPEPVRKYIVPPSTQMFSKAAEYVPRGVPGQEGLHRLVCTLCMVCPIYIRLALSNLKRFQFWVSWLHTALWLPQDKNGWGRGRVGVILSSSVVNSLTVLWPTRFFYSEKRKMCLCCINNTLPVGQVMEPEGSKLSGIVLKGRECKSLGQSHHTAYLEWDSYTSYTIQEEKALVFSKLSFATNAPPEHMLFWRNKTSF